MSFQTYTVTSASFEAEAGSNISGGANPTVTLVISPAAGYTLTHSNFSIGNALPSQVQSATFSQAGANVNCLVTFANGFTMPASDVELLIDIDGAANEQTFTINGNYVTTESNTTGSSGTTAFSQTGVDGATVTLFTKTFTAASGKHFETPPYDYQSQGAEREDDAYIITYTDSALGGNLTARAYTVKYIIDGKSETLNNLNFVANAITTYVAPTEITGYGIAVNTIAKAGETRNVTIYGDPGAEVTFTTAAPYPVSTFYSTNNTFTKTVGATGKITHQLAFPENTTGQNKTWTFTLSGSDLASPFAQDNPFTIIQKL